MCCDCRQPGGAKKAAADDQLPAEYLSSPLSQQPQVNCQSLTLCVFHFIYAVTIKVVSVSGAAVNQPMSAGLCLLS